MDKLLVLIVCGVTALSKVNNAHAQSELVPGSEFHEETASEIAHVEQETKWSVMNQTLWEEKAISQMPVTRNIERDQVSFGTDSNSDEGIGRVTITAPEIISEGVETASALWSSSTAVWTQNEEVNSNVPETVNYEQTNEVIITVEEKEMATRSMETSTDMSTRDLGGNWEMSTTKGVEDENMTSKEKNIGESMSTNAEAYDKTVTPTVKFTVEGGMKTTLQQQNDDTQATTIIPRTVETTTSGITETDDSKSDESRSKDDSHGKKSGRRRGHGRKRHERNWRGEPEYSRYGSQWSRPGRQWSRYSPDYQEPDFPFRTSNSRGQFNPNSDANRNWFPNRDSPAYRPY